ncbi:unnamed protein product [Bursaphelenchus xylophilus]|uniref:(pine wood nematode) hypothetical protein n=1 Tax=Bursaphelenchus xylophilus TaxID=6326 RepID=A0A1I7RLU8_BURXY|nr:str-19 [Bursaphelenchus xylophilus]CAD5220255.1 unnamed protein product [Bursaphelenchus xylophilus]CAG9106226.1 unnamed protein product [Bursaphelenchus xylophilus]
MTGIEQIYRTSDVVGSSLGVIINTLVLYIIKQTFSKKIAAYSRMLVGSTTYSILYGLVEFTTQHELFMNDGILFCVPKGFEKYLGRTFLPLFLFPHVTLSCFGLYILPCNYHYEYSLLSDPTSVSRNTLLRNIAVSLIGAILPGILSLFAAKAAGARPEKYYKDMLSPEWLTEGESTYMVPMDARDIETQVYFGTVGALSTCFFFAALYYVWKIRRFFHQNQKKSTKTKSLQDQFTRVVITQGINTFFFAFIPLSVISLGTLVYVPLEMMGLLVMIPLSWLPVANGLYSLLAIRKYREYFLRMLGKKKINAGHRMVSTVTENTMGTSNTMATEEEEEKSHGQSH